MREFYYVIRPVGAGMSSNRVALLLLLFLRVLQTKGKLHTAMCARIDPFQMPYEYYKAGNVTIGAIVTQFGFIFDDVTFIEDPNGMSVTELL